MKRLQPFATLCGVLVAVGAGWEASAAERLQAAVQRVPSSVTQVGSNPAKSLRIAGTAVDADGKPVAGATIECYQEDTTRRPSARSDMELAQSVTTDASGAFAFSVPRTVTILLGRKAGLAPVWTQYWNQSKDSADERLVFAPATTLAGVVVDESDQPVAGAEVFVSIACGMRQIEEGRIAWGYLSGKIARDSFSARTGADGRFVIEGFPTNAVTDLGVKTPGKVLRETPRESIGPETMRFSAGQQDIKLVVEPAGSIEGKVVEQESGQPLSGVKVWAQANQPGFFGGSAQEPAQSGPDGTFHLGEKPAGKYELLATFGTNAIPEWVAETVAVTVEAGKPVRDVKIAATRGGFLEVTVVGKEDRKPIAKIGVSASKKKYYGYASSGSNGTALLRLPVGKYQVSANKDSSRSEPLSVTVESGRTNHVAIELNPPPTISGIVRDASGAAAAGIAISIVPGWGVESGDSKTDANGRYEVSWDPKRFGRSDQQYYLVARDAARKLAAAHEIEEGAKSLDLKLEPGLTLAGRVEDENGKPLSNATAQIFFWTGNSGYQLPDKPVRTGADGRFEIAALPPGHRYSMNVTAKGYGSASHNAEEGSDATRIEFPVCTLKVANQKLAGQVLDAEDKPVARANVYMYGQGQPNGSVRTDEKGRFKFEAVCEGTVQFSVNSGQTYGSARAEAGDTNVVVRLGETAAYGFSSSRETPRRASLKGKPLPDLAPLELTPTAGKPVLLCLFDIDQRPSRRFIKQLAEQHEALQQKGLSVLGLQAAVTTADAFKEWKAANTVPFPVGRVAQKSDKTKWASDADKLPWLILTDADCRVTAEGFALDELDAKLKPASK